jgi:hypothetical protein
MYKESGIELSRMLWLYVFRLCGELNCAIVIFDKTFALDRIDSIHFSRLNRSIKTRF